MILPPPGYAPAADVLTLEDPDEVARDAAMAQAPPTEVANTPKGRRKAFRSGGALR